MADLHVPPGTVLDTAGRQRRRALRLGGVVLGCALVLGLGFYLREVFNPLLIALIVAYVLNPLVEALERRGFTRQRVVLGLYGVVLLGAAGALTFVSVKSVIWIDQLVETLAGEPLLDPDDPEDRALIQAHEERFPATGAPAAMVRVARASDGRFFLDEDGDGRRDHGLAERWALAASSSLGGAVSEEDLRRGVQVLRDHAKDLLRTGAHVTESLRSSFSRLTVFLSYLLLVPLYTYFLLGSFPALRDTVRDHLPGAYRARIVHVARQIDRQAAAFFRGKLMLALAKGLVTWLGFWIVGVPFSFFIGMGAGLLSVVPFLGPLCGGGLAVLVSFGAEGFALQVVLILVVLGVAEAVEAVAQPVVLGREVGLSPLTLILSFFVFGKLLGLFGVLLAVPIACAVKVLFFELVFPHLEALAREPGPRIAEDAPPDPA